MDVGPLARAGKSVHLRTYAAVAVSGTGAHGHHMAGISGPAAACGAGSAAGAMAAAAVVAHKSIL